MNILKSLLLLTFLPSNFAQASASTLLKDEGLEQFTKMTRIEPRLQTFNTAIASCKMTGDLPCARAYTNKNSKLWILELCTNSGSFSPGLYINQNGNVEHYEWFDSSHFKWACNEECNKSSGGCSYGVSRIELKKVSELIYRFDINLSHGEYGLSIQNKKFKVIKKKITNDPS
jgi:hypothetical protein